MLHGNENYFCQIRIRVGFERDSGQTLFEVFGWELNAQIP